jgi:K+ transporter
MKPVIKDNIPLIIAFILLIAVFLWVCNKEKWRSKKEPQQIPQKGMYANFSLHNPVYITNKNVIMQHDI